MQPSRQRCLSVGPTDASRRGCARWRFSIAAACVAGMWIQADAVLAQPNSLWLAGRTVLPNGTAMRMPQNRAISRKSRLQLSIDTRWANNFGYRPVQVNVSSPKLATADRLITIRLHVSGWAWLRSELSVEADFELPTGKTSFTTTVDLPQYRLDAQFYWWDVWVDGVKDNDLSLDEKNARQTMLGVINPGAQTNLSCLVVSPSTAGVLGSPRTLVAPNTNQFDVLAVSLNEMPRRWIEYTCFDVVALQIIELRLLRKSDPAAYQALLRWVRAGGQLWVSNLGNNFEELADLSRLLKLRAAISLAGDEDRPAGTTIDRGESAGFAWRPVRFRDGNPEGQVVTFMDVNTGETRSERDPQVIAQLQSDQNFVITEQQLDPTIGAMTEATPGRRRRGWPRDVDSSRWFVDQRLGLGTVRALRGENDLALFAQGRRPATNSMVAGFAESMGMNAEAIAAMAQGGDQPPPGLMLNLRSTKGWSQRHGMSPGNPNFEFANLLVPGVGLAPVTEFRVLITLFVLLIGPGNYWLLKRFRRLHLLVLTVPLAALATTATLFAYAIISDGFGTTVRVRSLTTLDQRTGEAACWARLSYYSGLAPSEGLTLPSDIAVYPIIPGWNEGNVEADLGGERELLWEPNQAKLASGWLRSRTPTQYLTVRSRKTPCLLELASANGKMRATNKLGTLIEFVLAIDDAGELFVGENMAPEARGPLLPIQRVDAIRRLREIAMAHQPQAPAALSAPDSDFMLLQRRQQMRQYRRAGFQYGEERLSNNLVNELLGELAGLSSEPALNLPPRSYIAVTQTGPEVVIGMSDVEEQESFHVVVGQW